MTQPTELRTPFSINQKIATNIETIKALLRLIDTLKTGLADNTDLDGMKTNLTEAEQIAVATFEQTNVLRSVPPVPADSLEAYDYAVIEVGRNLTETLEQLKKFPGDDVKLGKLADTVEQIHICLSEIKVGADTLVSHQQDAIRSATN